MFSDWTDNETSARVCVFRSDMVGLCAAWPGFGGFRIRNSRFRAQIGLHTLNARKISDHFLYICFVKCDICGCGWCLTQNFTLITNLRSNVRKLVGTGNYGLDSQNTWALVSIENWTTVCQIKYYFFCCTAYKQKQYVSCASNVLFNCKQYWITYKTRKTQQRTELRRVQ